MAVFRIQMPDGKVARIQADSPDQAMDFAKAGLKPTPAQADYTKARADAAAVDAHRGHGVVDALTQMPLPIGDEIRGAGAAGLEGVLNVGRAVTGKPTRDLGAVYRANQDQEEAFQQQMQQEHPIATTVGTLLAGLTAAPVRGRSGAAPGAADPNFGATPGGVSGFLKGMGTAAATGGAYGGLYGAAEGHSLQERAENAKRGTEGGALMGGLLHGVGVPVASAVRKGAADLADTVGGMIKPKPPVSGPAVATPEDARRAAIAATQLARKKGITSATVADRAAPYAGKDVMAAELIGPEGVNQLAATARRGGQTGGDVRARVYARQQAASERIQQDFQDQLGVSPAAAAGDIDQMVEEGQAAARPLYDAALGGEGGVWNDQLQGLAQRPVIRQALSSADVSARNAGRVGEGLAMGRVEVPNPADFVEPPDVGQAVNPAAMRRAPARAPSQGPSLMQFIAGRGGAADAGGDLAAMDAGQWHLGRPFQKPVIGQGDLDRLGEAAWEAGYFPELTQRPTLDQVQAAIRQELQGRPRFARSADQGALDRMAGRSADEELAYRGSDGADLPDPDAYGARPAPETEPAHMEAPTAASWDSVKKRLDALVERDPATGKVITTGEAGIRNRDLATAANDLRRALAGDETGQGAAIPGYREALNASGDYMSVRGAYERASGRLTQGTVRDFGKLWASLKTDGERNAVKAALANDVTKLWERGQLKGGKFAIPGVQQKLELAFGKGPAATFIGRMEKEAELAASGARAAPYGGSPTMGLQEASGEMDAAGHVSDVTRIGGKLMGGKPLSAAVDGALTLIKNSAARARTRGMNEATRDAYGAILQMGPEDFASFLAEWEKLPEATKRSFPLPAGLIGGSMVGQAQVENRPDR